MLRNGGGVAAPDKELADALADPREHRGKGSEHLGKRVERTADAERIAFVAGLCVRLGEHFRKQEHKQSDDDRRNGERRGKIGRAAEELTRDQNGKCGAAYMHHVVSDKKGGEGLVKIVDKIHHVLCALVSILRIGLHSDLVDRGKRYLTRRKIGAYHKEKHQQNRI